MQFHATMMGRRHTKSVNTIMPRTLGQIRVQTTSFRITTIPRINTSKHNKNTPLLFHWPFTLHFFMHKSQKGLESSPNFKKSTLKPFCGHMGSTINLLHSFWVNFGPLFRVVESLFLASIFYWHYLLRLHGLEGFQSNLLLRNFCLQLKWQSFIGRCRKNVITSRKI